MKEYNMEELLTLWSEAKETERRVVDARREVEDEIRERLKLPEDFEGSLTEDYGQYKMKLSARMNRTVNTETLQQLATDAGVFEHLHSLFRWKAEINAKAWAATSPEITQPLLGAITTKPGRPSFVVTRSEA